MCCLKMSDHFKAECMSHSNRHFYTKEEKLDALKEYEAQLERELKGVREAMKENK